ncbi:unnamed protein product [Ectocarpus fasciculatus]
MCNAVGELTLQGVAGELTRWSLLTDEACDALMDSKPRLVKISTLARPATMSRQSFTGDDNNSGGGSGGGGGTLSSSKGRSARGMLGRLSLGGSKKNIADVFAVEPPLRRDSSGGGGSTRSLLSSSAGGSSGRAAAGRGGEQTEQHQRDALFGQREAGGGSGDGETSAVGGARGGVSGAHAAASEARDLAIERGEKLENLVDRSRQLEDSAMAFGDMAKQLRKQQEDEACCVS